MTIVVLRTGDTVPELRTRRGEFFDWIRDTVGEHWRGPWREHDVREGGEPPPLSGVAGFIVTGSPSSVTERAPWMLKTEAYLRTVHHAGIPVLGICFGHQILAQALGGEVTPNPRGREIGTVGVRRVPIVADPLLHGVDDVFEVNASHVDTVASLPPGARVLAHTDLEPHAAYAVGETTRGVQFHPEFDGDITRTYVQVRAEKLRAEGHCPVTIERRVRDVTHGPRILQNFVKHFVLPALQKARGAVRPSVPPPSVPG